MPRENEEAFKEVFLALLHKIAIKARVDRLTRASDMALANQEAAASIVSKLCLKELKAIKPAYRLKIFYLISAIVRESVAKYGSRSKYAARWVGKLESMANTLAEIPSADKIQVGRVLQLWWRDGVFPPRALTKLQAIFPASLTPNTTSAKKSSQKHSSRAAGASGGSREKNEKSASASVERTLTYWDADLGTEVVILKRTGSQHDEPASPVRDGLDNPAQEPSPPDESPLLPDASNVNFDKMNEDLVNEDEESQVPHRRMITLGVAKTTKI